MRFVFFCHSLVSDWNHSNAHSLRGVATALLAQGHSVQIFEPADGWSLRNLREQCGEGVIKAFHATYPRLRSSFYDLATIDLDAALADADVVIVHEWNDPELVRRIGQHRAASQSYRLLFHDSAHRPLTNPLEIRSDGLSQYDGVLASGEVLRRMYVSRGWAEHVWTWRDGADTRVFRPWPAAPVRAFDVVWIGNWGDGERRSELQEFLVDPIRALGLRARFYGVSYPEEAVRTLRSAGIDYAGWIPDFCVPSALAAGRFSVHIPQRLQADGLPRTPVTGVLEALACGVPLVTTPWDECQQMFEPGSDLLVARDARELERHLVDLHSDAAFAQLIADRGYRTVLSRHTCAHRADELLVICREMGARESAGVAEVEEEAELVAYPRVSRPARTVPVSASTPVAWH